MQISHIFESCLTAVAPFLSPFLFCFHVQTMSKIQRHQQEALWEFVHTELTYINKLIIIKDVRCHSLPALIIKTFNFLHAKAEKGFSTGCLTTLCLPLTVGNYSSYQPAPAWISPGGQSAKHAATSALEHKQTNLLHSTLNLQTYFPLICISLPYIEHPLKLIQNTTHELENIAQQHISTEKMETIAKQGRFTLTL